MIAEAAMRNPIDLAIADADDKTLEAIVQLRKKINSEGEREGFVAGLYFISLADADYTESEKALVEGTACALGIDAQLLSDLEAKVDEDSDAAIESFAKAGGRRYRDQLFEEMAALTYLKGYQLASEDEAMKRVADAMEIKAEKAEKTMYELYMATQGFDVSTKSTIAKAAMGVGAIAAGAAVCAITAGVAAPVIGATIGGLQGLTGIAAAQCWPCSIGRRRHCCRWRWHCSGHCRNYRCRSGCRRRRCGSGCQRQRKH